jgi:hypothetical protein
MTEETLKPCPFCGDICFRIPKNIYINWDNELKIEDTNVQCTNCGAEGSKIAYLNDTKKAWNERKCKCEICKEND